MSTEEHIIKISKDDEVLKVLSQNLKNAKNDFLQLQLSGKASAQELQKAATEVTKLGTAYNNARKEVTDLANANKSLSLSQKLDIGSNVGNIISGVKNLGSIIGEVIGEAKQLGVELFEAAHKGAEFQVLRENFDKLNGGVDQAEKTLQLFRKASGGHLNNEELIKFSNTMSSLGYTTTTTTQLLDLQHTIAHTTGIEFEQAGIALNKYITTGGGKGLPAIGINIAQVDAKMVQLTGKTLAHIHAMDQQDQQYYRTLAITELYGKSLDEIAKKHDIQVDKIAAVKTAFENLASIIEVGVANAFIGTAGSMDKFLANLSTTVQKAQQYGQQLGSVLSIFGDVALAPINAIGEGLDEGVYGIAANILKTGVKIKQNIDEFKQASDLYKFHTSPFYKNIEKAISENEADKHKKEIGNLPSTGVQHTGKTPKEKTVHDTQLDAIETIKLQVENNKLLNQKVDYLDAIQKIDAALSQLENVTLNKQITGNEVLRKKNELLALRNNYEKESIAKGTLEIASDIKLQNEYSTILHKHIDAADEIKKINEALLKLQDSSILKYLSENEIIRKQIELTKLLTDLKNTNRAGFLPGEKPGKNQPQTPGRAPKDIAQEKIEKFLSASSEGIGNAQTIISTLLKGEDNFATKFLGVLNDGVSIMTSIISLLNTVLGDGGGFDLFKTLFGAGIGFVTGGPVGVAVGAVGASGALGGGTGGHQSHARPGHLLGVGGGGHSNTQKAIRVLQQSSIQNTVTREVPMIASLDVKADKIRVALKKAEDTFNVRNS